MWVRPSCECDLDPSTGKGGWEEVKSSACLWLLQWATPPQDELGCRPWVPPRKAHQKASEQEWQRRGILQLCPAVEKQAVLTQQCSDRIRHSLCTVSSPSPRTICTAVSSTCGTCAKIRKRLFLLMENSSTPAYIFLSDSTANINLVCINCAILTAEHKVKSIFEVLTIHIFQGILLYLKIMTCFAFIETILYKSLTLLAPVAHFLWKWSLGLTVLL